MRQVLAFLLIFFVWVGIAQAEVAVPPLRALVTDLTGTLSATDMAALDSRLKAYEREKGSQIAVLIVPTTQPEEIEQYSMRVVEQWKLGRHKVDDGVLFLIAKNDRRMRIEVGYGLEGALPDITAKRIISDIVSPAFKAGDFVGGITAGVDAIIASIQGEPLPVPTVSNEQDDVVGFVVFGGVCGAILSFIFKLFLPPRAAVPLAVLLTFLLVWLFFSWIMALLAAFFALLGALGLFNNIRGAGGSRGSNSGRGWGGGGGGRFGGGGASGRW
jgi:uncharacterized protein